MPRVRKVRQRAKRDANHNDIVSVFEAMGATWFDTSQIPGELDGLLGVAGIDQRVEIKDGAKFLCRRALSTEEVETIDSWNGRKPEIVESEEDAINLVNKLRRGER